MSAHLFLIGGSLFSIHSVNSDRELIFRAHKDEYFDVELKGSGLSAMISVWEYNAVNSLNTFFQDLAGFKTSWQGVHTWESLEGELSVSATCSTLGQVTFLVRLTHLTGSPEDWRVEAGLGVELGQLEKIAKEANTFFQKENA